MATIKVTSFNVVQEKHHAVGVIRKVIDSLNELLVGLFLLSFGFGFRIKNIQNQNNGIRKINVVVAEAILDGSDIFICLAKDLGVKEVGISVYFLRQKFEYGEGIELMKRTSLSL